MPERWILHCDCNSFFASVELLGHPDLQCLPVAVCGNAEERHGIILAKNEPAKKYGIKTAETVWQAKQKCPELVLLAPHHHRYSEMSKKVNAIYARYTDLVEPFSIDESWLDVTHSWRLFAPDPPRLADLIRETVRRELGITISVGVSFTKIFAKLGSDYKKPDATTVIRREDVPRIVWPLGVGELLFVGRRTRETLETHNIRTIGQLAAAPPAYLTGLLGRIGQQLSDYARGQNDSPVRPVGFHEEAKSIGNGMTFRRDLVSEADVRLGVSAMAESVAARLRRAGLRCTCVQLLIKDPSLKSISRQKQLVFATDLEKDIAQAALELVRENWPDGKPIRMLTVTAMNLTHGDIPAQTEMLKAPPQRDEKRARLEQALDGIRSRHGAASVQSASALGSDLGLSHDEDDD